MARGEIGTDNNLPGSVEFARTARRIASAWAVHQWLEAATWRQPGLPTHPAEVGGHLRLLGGTYIYTLTGILTHGSLDLVRDVQPFFSTILAGSQIDYGGGLLCWPPGWVHADHPILQLLPGSGVTIMKASPGTRVQRPRDDDGVTPPSALGMKTRLRIQLR
jgi:hypothetical protein